MSQTLNREFGAVITRLIQKENLTRKESETAFISLLANRETSARKDAVILNAGLIFLVAGKAKDLEEGIQAAAILLETGAAFKTLENWVRAQNADPEKGLATLHSLV